MVYVQYGLLKIINVRMHFQFCFFWKYWFTNVIYNMLNQLKWLEILNNFIEIKVQIYLLYNTFANFKVQKSMWLFWIAQMFYALHCTYILPHICEFKPQKLPYNYHMIFKSISSLVKTMDMISILIQCTLPNPNWLVIVKICLAQNH